MSSAYKLGLDIITERYDPQRWNIYPFHFSDGDNWSDSDNKLCVDLVHKLLEVSNLFGYGEIRDGGYTSSLMSAFTGIHDPRFVIVTITWNLCKPPHHTVVAEVQSMDGEVDPARVAVYIRWSTDDQADGTTLAVQQESALHYIKAQGWQYREELVFIDDGYSGGTLDRPALTNLRDQVKQGAVQCVVVYKLDRLSRSVIDTVNLVLQEWEGRCHVKSTREPIDTASPAGKLFFYMLVSYAEWERSLIRERTMAGKKKRAEQGRNPGIKPPYGFTRGARPGDWAVCEHEAGVVHRIYREYAGGRGLAAIAQGLNADGHLTRTGAPWRPSTIHYILRNEAYRGTLIYGARSEARDRATGRRRVTRHAEPRHARVEGALPAIIESGLWQKAQAQPKTRPRKSARPYLLTGIARCRCGAPLVGGLVDRRVRTYSCSARRTRGAAACSAGSVRADQAEEIVLAALKARCDGARLSAALDRGREDKEAAPARWAARAADLRRRLQRLHGDYDAGRIPAELYAERAADLKAQLEAAVPPGQPEAKEGGWEGLSPEEIRHVLHHTVQRLTLWRSGAERSPADRRRLTPILQMELRLYGVT